MSTRSAGVAIANVRQDFDRAMMGVYRSAKAECGYNARLFLRMLHEHGGLGTAKRLLAVDHSQYGFEKLWECGRLDLTVECLVLGPKYRDLFDAADLDRARKRLRDHGFDSARCEG